MKKALCLTLSLTLVACGGGGGGGSDSKPINTSSSSPSNGYMLKTFTIGDTNTGSVSPYINGGFFSLGWEVSAPTSSYNITAYLSENDTYSSADMKLFSKNCGSVTNDCGKQTTEKAECKYTNMNTLECAGDIALLKFDKLPNKSYIILRSCKGVVSFDCDTKAAAITFE